MYEEKRYLPVSETEGIFFHMMEMCPHMKNLPGIAVIMNGYKGNMEFLVEICDKMDYYIKIPSPERNFMRIFGYVHGVGL